MNYTTLTSEQFAQILDDHIFKVRAGKENIHLDIFEEARNRMTGIVDLRNQVNNLEDDINRLNEEINSLECEIEELEQQID